MDKDYIIIKFLIDNIEKHARGRCFAPKYINELIADIDYLKNVLEICRNPTRQ